MKIQGVFKMNLQNNLPLQSLIPWEFFDSM